MYQGALAMLRTSMDAPLVNRNGNQYSSGMSRNSTQYSEAVITMNVDTTMFPAHWRHMDDDTTCDRHEVCNRATYIRGGRPNFGTLPE